MTTPTPCLLPAIRARMGDWWYYITMMTFKDIAERVKKVEEIQETSSLKTWIQRELKDERKREIAEYLHSQHQRFFNGLVLGIFDGAPDWFPVSVSTGHVQTGVALDDRAASSFGFIKLTGQEQIFAIDGQHRVEGIKRALEVDGGRKLAGEEQTAIFVAHKTDEAGRQRTRRLFTTLNKYAKPVSRGEIIALSEDDSFAIVTRRLIEEYPGLGSDFVPLYKTANIPTQDSYSLTSVISLYEVAKAINVSHGNRASSRLIKGPPVLETTNDFYLQATEFWNAMKKHFPAIAKVCGSEPEKEVAGKYRHGDGGHFLFRPFCLVAFAKAVRIVMGRGSTTAEAVKVFSHIETDINRDPWRHVVWNPSKKTMINKNALLVMNLLLRLARQKLSPADFNLKEEYEAAIGEAETSFRP